MSSRATTMILALALSACATDLPPTESPYPSAASDPGDPDDSGRTWVMVTGPADSEAPEDLVLEIGDTAWLGYGGVASVETEEALDVRLIGQESCRSFAAFSAPPASMWVIRFAADGTVAVEDVTGGAMELGPALTERDPSGCSS